MTLQTIFKTIAELFWTVSFQLWSKMCEKKKSIWKWTSKSFSKEKKSGKSQNISTLNLFNHKHLYLRDIISRVNFSPLAREKLGSCQFLLFFITLRKFFVLELVHQPWCFNFFLFGKCQMYIFMILQFGLQIVSNCKGKEL